MVLMTLSMETSDNHLILEAEVIGVIMPLVLDMEEMLSTLLSQRPLLVRVPLL